MSLRDRALAAHTEADQTTRQRARDALAAVGVTRDDALEVQQVDRVDGVVRVLLSDGDVHLAVRVTDNAATVHLVDPDESHVGQVSTLADLGRLLTET